MNCVRISTEARNTDRIMAICVQCEDCKFANWDATLFRDHEEGRWEGGHYIPPYNEQFDVYCIKHERFFMEQEITGDCQDGEYGPNNYHDVCKEHYRQIDEFKKELKQKAVRRIKAEQAQLTIF